MGLVIDFARRSRDHEDQNTRQTRHFLNGRVRWQFEHDEQASHPAMNEQPQLPMISESCCIQFGSLEALTLRHRPEYRISVKESSRSIRQIKPVRRFAIAGSFRAIRDRLTSTRSNTTSNHPLPLLLLSVSVSLIYASSLSLHLGARRSSKHY